MTVSGRRNGKQWMSFEEAFDMALSGETVVFAPVGTLFADAYAKDLCRICMEKTGKAPAAYLVLDIPDGGEIRIRINFEHTELLR